MLCVKMAGGLLLLRVYAGLLSLRCQQVLLVRLCWLRLRLGNTDQADVYVVCITGGGYLELLQLIQLLLRRSCFGNGLNGLDLNFIVDLRAVVVAVFLELWTLWRATQQTARAFIMTQALFTE